MDLAERLATLRLIVVTGKGGTGKSVLTCALGRVLAAQGRRTLLLEVDPRENLHHLCGVPPSGGEIVEIERHLYLQNLKPAAVADWVVEKQVKISMLVKRVLASPIYHRFVEGAPGLTEIAVIGHALRVVEHEMEDASPIDTVVLDAPATGHGVFLLTAAKLFVEAIGEGPFADLARRVAGLVEDPAASGLVIVTLAEEMPVQESLELHRELEQKLGREPEVLVVNAVYPPLSPWGDQGGETLADAAPDDPLHRLWRDRRQVNEKELERLEAEWPGPSLELPLLAIDEGPELISELTAVLAELLGASEAMEGDAS